MSFASSSSLTEMDYVSPVDETTDPPAGVLTPSNPSALNIQCNPPSSSQVVSMTPEALSLSVPSTNASSIIIGRQRGSKYKRPSYKTRCQIHALRFHAKWELKDIGALFDLSLSTVSDICNNPATPRKIPGPGPLLRSPQRQALIACATASALNRRRPSLEIASLTGIHAITRTLRKAFHLEGYHRRIARIKPFLNQAAKNRRFAWALAHAH